MTLEQVGSDVVATGSGAIDLTGLIFRFHAIAGGPPEIAPNFALITFLPNLISRSPLRRGFPVVFLALALAFVAVPQTAPAVTPAPDGGYPNQNTAEGDSALQSLTSGIDNTVNGFRALFSNTIGVANTAIGSGALESNTTGNNNTATGSDTLAFNTASGNTANGSSALSATPSAHENTATGASALSKHGRRRKYGYRF